MGFLSGILSGGTALNILGGMAQQYNKISDEQRAEAFTLRRDEKKFENDKELVKLRNKLNQETEIKKAIEIENIRKEAEKEKREAALKANPLNITEKIKAIFPNRFQIKDDFFYNKSFVIPRKKEYTSKENYYTAVKNVFSPQFFAEMEQREPSFNIDQKNLYNSIKHTLIDAGIDTLEVITQLSQDGTKSSEIKVADLALVDSFLNEYSPLASLFEKKRNLRLQTLKKDLAAAVGNNGTVDEDFKTEGKTSSIKFNDNHDRFYTMPDYSAPGKRFNLNKQEIQNTIKQVKHPRFGGLSLNEKMDEFDKLVAEKAPALASQGFKGEIVVRAVTELKKRLAKYDKPVGDLRNPDAINNFFLNSAVGKMIIANPDLAIDVVAMALPSSIISEEEFRAIPGGIVPGGMFKDSDQFRNMKKANDVFLQEKYGKLLGFDKPQNLQFKLDALQRVTRPLGEMITLLTKRDFSEKALVGLSGEFYSLWQGIQYQMRNVLSLTGSDVFNNGIFKKSGIDALKKVQNETNQFLKDSQDSSLSKARRQQALFNYFGGVLTFTMAASVQSGSEGSVDSRTISDKDVALWRNILGLGTKFAYSQGTLDILLNIQTDTKNKIAIMQGMSDSDLRIKSAAKILDKAFFGQVSSSSYQSMQNKYGTSLTRDISDPYTEVGLVKEARFNKKGIIISPEKIVDPNEFSNMPRTVVNRPSVVD